MNIENARVNQLNLFPIISREVCERIGLNWLSAIELYNMGFLSFDPTGKETLDTFEETELLFLGSLVVGGCDKDMLKFILKKLKKPYQYQIDKIYYCWSSKEWLLLPKENEFDNYSIVEEWIEELEDEKDIEQLEELMDIVESALSRVKGT